MVKSVVQVSIFSGSNHGVRTMARTMGQTPKFARPGPHPPTRSSIIIENLFPADISRAHLAVQSSLDHRPTKSISGKE